MSSPFSDAGNAVFPAPDACIDTVRPRDEATLRALLRDAQTAGTPVTIGGALTGLAGAAVPPGTGCRVDMTGLDTVPDQTGYRRITPFLLLSETDPTQGLVAPGVTLQTLNDALDGLDLWYPPHPGEWRATLGGNVAANASGPRTFSFGSTREYVTSLRIVLADGDMLTLRRGTQYAAGRRFSLTTESGRLIEGALPEYLPPRVKNAAGLFVEPDMDLIDLFIGSEGILGTFTTIGLRFLPRRAIRSDLFFFTTPAEALACADVLRPLRARAASYPDSSGDGVVSLEYFDAGALELAREAGQEVPEGANAALEVETFADDAGSRVKITLLAERLQCRGTLPPERVSAFRYAVPRRVAELLKQRGQPKFGTDFAVPADRFAELYAFYEAKDAEFGSGSDRSRGDGGVRTAKWGHIGDCHLHCNFLCLDAADQERARAIYLKLVRKAVELGGTLSAEHGVGKKTLADESGTERPYLWYLYGEAGLRQIAAVKRAFDPKGILNPGNMVPVGLTADGRA